MPNFTLRTDREGGTTETFRKWYEDKEVEEWIQGVAGVLDQGWNDQLSLFFRIPLFFQGLFLFICRHADNTNSSSSAAQRGARHFEFATGYNYYFGPERYLVGEQYFTHSAQLIVRTCLDPFPVIIPHSEFDNYFPLLSL